LQNVKEICRIFGEIKFSSKSILTKHPRNYTIYTMDETSWKEKFIENEEEEQ